MKHTFAEKLNYVSLALKGVPQSQICRRYGLGQHYLESLMDRYKQYGEDGLKRKAYKSINVKFKGRLVRLYEEKSLTLRQICIKYSVSKTAFESWVRQVRSKGYESLYEPQRQGRPPKAPMARPKKKEPQTELEKLQAENLRLRAENALLKKVKALVEEQEARARLNGQKPSMN